MMPFTPVGSTVNVVPTSSTQALALAAAPSSAGSIQRINNASTVDVFITFGDSTVTATLAAGHPLRVDETQDFSIGANVTHVAVIGTGTPTGGVYCTSGSI
jgi:hypothetical protein